MPARTSCSGYIAGLCVVLSLAAGPIAAAAADGATTVQPAGNEVKLRLPVIPSKAPRPAEGPAAEEKWQTAREGADAAPLASFIDSLRDNDAAFEVTLGQGRLLTTKGPIAGRERTGVVAVGDPTIIEFELLPNPRMIRLIGKRAGITDMSITTADGQTYSLEVRVVYDLELLRAQVKQVFPDISLKLAQLREHVVVEGQARSPEQVTQILRTLEAYLDSLAPSTSVRGQQPAGPYTPGMGRSPGAGPGTPAGGPSGPAGPGNAPLPPIQGSPDREALPEQQPNLNTSAAFPKPQIINLIRVPGVHQVSLQVRIAELNRTGIREIGADILGVNPHTGNIFGTSIGGATVDAAGLLGIGGLASAASGKAATSTTAFGIFPSGDFEILLHALRRNALLAILAEPNLVAMSGHRANFLAGGQFPVPVPQTMGGVANSVTVEFKDFGVQLDFVPFVQEDGVIRLQVTPEVSSIDFALGTTLVKDGQPVPGLNTRRATTTVEMRQGQTLAIAGLLQVELDGDTKRIPGLGDLPYIGPLFSNTSHKRVEKELLVVVTPYLVSPMNPGQVPPLPGADVKTPTDLEFYLMNRIEGRSCKSRGEGVDWSDPLGVAPLLKLERQCVSGPAGFSEPAAAGDEPAVSQSPRRPMK